MGFLNKFMDALGIELEIEFMQDVGELLYSIGWNPGKHINKDISLDQVSSKPIKKDDFWMYLRILKNAPRAVIIEKKWTKRVPNNYLQAKEYLEKYTGYGFPVLENIKYKRVTKTLTAVLKDNLNPVMSHVGIRVKYLSSLVYHMTIKDKVLAKEAECIITKLAPDIDAKTIEKIKEIGVKSTPIDMSSCKKNLSNLFNTTCLTKEESAAILFAKAMSNSPAEVNKAVLIEITPHMKPQSSIELGVWVSLQQLLHRLNSYYEIIKN